MQDALHLSKSLMVLKLKEITDKAGIEKANNKEKFCHHSTTHFISHPHSKNLAFKVSSL
jgi:hypothetical protein